MLRSWITSLRRRPPTFSAVAPETPFYLIGDIHGRSDLLETALSQLDSEYPIFFVGDYIDRGEDSAGVLQMLVDRDNCFCIRGNHEEMLLAFLEDPITNGPRWLRYGGLQTLASYGISSVTETSNGLELEAIRDNLRQKMGAEQVFWLRTLPYCHRNGNVAVVHAGADPRVSLEDQFRDTLVWGHPGFGKELRQDGLWIAHGHTIVDAPGAENGVISVDIGAYATGRLCIAHIAEGEVGFRVVR